MKRPSSTVFRIVAAIGVLLTATPGCRIRLSPTSVADAPSIAVTNPLPDQTALVGEPVLVNSTSVDPDGIKRVELWVDGRQVRVDSNPSVESPYIVSQPWQSDTPGTHIIVVKAFDARETVGQSQPVIITLEVEALRVPEPTPVGHVSPSPGAEGIPLTPLAPTWTATSPPRPTWTPTPTMPSTKTPGVMCTPPPCQAGEVFFCPSVCPGGCGTQCATPTPTIEPPSFEPTGIETHSIFIPVWNQQGVKDYLGYPTEAASDDRRYARQYFERGYLYWWDRPNSRGHIWAVEMPQPVATEGLHWTGPYEDTWDGGDPYSCDAARANPNGPVAGFGKLWCDHSNVALAIGAAREPERGTGDSSVYGVVQFFQGGVMLYNPLDREVWVLFNGGTWQRHPR